MKCFSIEPPHKYLLACWEDTCLPGHKVEVKWIKPDQATIDSANPVYRIFDPNKVDRESIECWKAWNDLSWDMWMCAVCETKQDSPVVLVSSSNVDWGVQMVIPSEAEPLDLESHAGRFVGLRDEDEPPYTVVLEPLDSGNLDLSALRDAFDSPNALFSKSSEEAAEGWLKAKVRKLRKIRTPQIFVFVVEDQAAARLAAERIELMPDAEVTGVYWITWPEKSNSVDTRMSKEDAPRVLRWRSDSGDTYWAFVEQEKSKKQSSKEKQKQENGQTMKNLSRNPRLLSPL